MVGDEGVWRAFKGKVAVAVSGEPKAGLGDFGAGLGDMGAAEATATRAGLPLVASSLAGGGLEELETVLTLLGSTRAGAESLALEGIP